jgi:hypothetical protein
MESSQDGTRSGGRTFLEWILDRAGEPIRLRFGYESDVSMPIEIFVGWPQNYGFIGKNTLPISEDLESDLVGHLGWWQENANPYDDDEDDEDDEDPTWTAWAEEGCRLRERLQAELGPVFVVARWEDDEVPPVSGPSGL